MAFCSQCGNTVASDMRFCPGCGHQLNVAAVSETALTPDINTASYDPSSQYTSPAEFKIILISSGSCSIADALPLLEEILGYTSTKARNLLRAAPVEIAQCLTLTQAQYIAQALTEYGMEVSITNTAGDYVNAADSPTSVFDAAGNFLPAVAVALATIGISNRIHRVSRWTPAGPPPPLFRLGFHRPRPLMHFRRSLFRPAPVHPRPHIVAPPRPPMPKRAPRPSHPHGGFGMGGAPRPSAPPRRSPGPGGRGPRGGGFGGGGSFGGGFGGRR